MFIPRPLAGESSSEGLDLIAFILTFSHRERNQGISTNNLPNPLADCRT